MRLTTKSRYGTRLILDVAVYGTERPVPLSDVSKRQNISLKYLEQLSRKLRNAGIINSQRGPFGGHIGLNEPGTSKCEGRLNLFFFRDVHYTAILGFFKGYADGKFTAFTDHGVYIDRAAVIPDNPVGDEQP